MKYLPEGIKCYWCNTEITKGYIFCHTYKDGAGATTYDENGKMIPYKPELDEDIVETLCPSCHNFTIIVPSFTDKMKKYMVNKKEELSQMKFYKSKKWYCSECGKKKDWKDVYWLYRCPKSRKHKMCKKCKNTKCVPFKPKFINGCKQSRLFEEAKQ